MICYVLDTREGMERHKQFVESYDMFVVVDYDKYAWSDSWMKMDMFVKIQTII